MVYINDVKMIAYLTLLQKFVDRLVSDCQTQHYMYYVTTSYMYIFQS